MNRRKSMRITIHKNTDDPQKKYRIGMVSKIFYLGAIYTEHFLHRLDLSVLFPLQNIHSSFIIKYHIIRCIICYY